MAMVRQERRKYAARVLSLPIWMMILCTSIRTTSSLSLPSSNTSPLSPSQISSQVLANKRAVITGASGGIGAAIAQTLASHGADVLLHYHTRRDGAKDVCRSIRESGGTCRGIIQCDFRSPSAIDKMWNVICSHDAIGWHSNDNSSHGEGEGEEGGIDILVNNAGIVTKLAAEDDDDSLSAWHETMAVNLHAPLQLSLLAKPSLQNRSQTTNSRSTILNISSIHGARSVEYMTAYAASKAALDSLTRGLALEYAPLGINVNGLAPGVVPVERTQQLFDDVKVQDMWRPHLPVGRLGTVQDVAQTALLLCTSEWMTGTVLTIDGGSHARANMPFRPRPAKPSLEGDDGDDDCSGDVRFESL